MPGRLSRPEDIQSVDGTLANPYGILGPRGLTDDEAGLPDWQTGGVRLTHNALCADVTLNGPFFAPLCYSWQSMMPRRGLHESTEKRRLIAEVIAANGAKNYCDDCVRAAAKVNRIYATEEAMSRIAAEMRFLREKSVCAGCGQTRTTTRAGAKA